MWNQAVGYALKVNALMVVIVRTLQNHMSAIALQALRVIPVLQTSMNVSRTNARTMPPVSMVSPIIPVTVSKAGRVGCKCIYFISSFRELETLKIEKFTFLLRLRSFLSI